MTASLEDQLAELSAAATPPEGVDYRLTISHGTFGVPEPLKVGDDLGLRIGDEVTALVRIRITGRSEREPMGSYDRHTVTTDAKIVEFVEVDGSPLPQPEPAKAEQKIVTTRKSRRADRLSSALLGAFMAISVAYLVLGIVQAITR